MGNFASKFRKYGPFSASEVKSLAITILALTFIVAFNDGRDEFSLVLWLGNFLLWLVIVSISTLIKQLGHRIIGIRNGFRVEYSIWWYGIIISLAASIITRGSLWLLIPGGIMIHHIKVHRLGFFRYGLNMRSLSIVAISGPLANIAFATIIIILQRIFVPLAGSTVLRNAIVFNLAYAAFSMLPIPPLDGSRVIYDSRMIYMFSFGVIIVYAFLVYAGIYSIMLALLAGTLIGSLYYFLYERNI